MAEPVMLEPEGLAPPASAYSHASRVAANELLFVAGQVALDERGELVGAGDIGAQTRQVYRNIELALAAGGATWRNVVRMTTYLVGTEQIDGFRAARQETYGSLFPDGAFPPHTLLVIAGLASPDFLIEIDTVAAL